MMINDELLNKLEKLSAIKISPEKREETKRQLSEIVGFVEILNELDLKSVDYAKHGATLFRADERNSATQEGKNSIIADVLKHAPKTDGQFFLVPKIIE